MAHAFTLCKVSKLHLRRNKGAKLLALGPELGRVYGLYLYLSLRTGVWKSFLA